MQIQTTNTGGNLERCPDCGIQLQVQTSPSHPYLGASASCWALYTEVLAREYSVPALMSSVHRLTVDAYCAQHPGKAERRTIQSVWIHLTGLYLTIELGLAHDFARRVIGALTGVAGGLTWLTPPSYLGDFTVIDVASAKSDAEHEELVRLWAHGVWNAWKTHHTEIISLVSRLGICPSPRRISPSRNTQGRDHSQQESSNYRIA